MTELLPKSADEKNIRYQQLLAWVKAALLAGNLHAGKTINLQTISGDAGFRRYFRILDGGNDRPSMLAVDAPPETEKNQAFCHIAQLFRQHGIHAPQIYAVDYQRGFMLIEDMGDTMYWPLLAKSQQGPGVPSPVSSALYRDAVHCLLKMQTIHREDAGLPVYDAEKLQQEMDLFPEWFVKKLLQTEMTTACTQLLQLLNQQLIQSALAQPQVVVHRDFHCRNLLQVTNNSPGVIDFQDAVIGPVTYDLVSLYRDCYIAWPEAQVKQWALDYREQCLQKKMMTNIPEQEFLRWFDWMGLQRHLKVLGIFARLHLRDHKPGYLKDLPLVIHYTLSVAKKYAEFADFVVWFERDLLPKIRNCDWYSEIKS